jgi:CheY-like chemotaxis protein
VTAAKILLIDDDVELLDMLKTYMEQEEFAVTATHVASTGVAEALSGHYGLVVLDVMMPHMNGIEVLRQIRTVNLIPVLMLTAKGDDADRNVIHRFSRGQSGGCCNVDYRWRGTAEVSADAAPRYRGAQSIGRRQCNPNGACSTKESDSQGEHSGRVYGRFLGGPLDEHSVAIVPDSPHFSPL